MVLKYHPTALILDICLWSKGSSMVKVATFFCIFAQTCQNVLRSTYLYSYTYAGRLDVVMSIVKARNWCSSKVRIRVRVFLET